MVSRQRSIPVIILINEALALRDFSLHELSTREVQKPFVMERRVKKRLEIVRFDDRRLGWPPSVECRLEFFGGKMSKNGIMTFRRSFSFSETWDLLFQNECTKYEAQNGSQFTSTLAFHLRSLSFTTLSGLKRVHVYFNQG